MQCNVTRCVICISKSAFHNESKSSITTTFSKDNFPSLTYFRVKFEVRFTFLSCNVSIHKNTHAYSIRTNAHDDLQFEIMQKRLN